MYQGTSFPAFHSSCSSSSGSAKGLRVEVGRERPQAVAFGVRCRCHRLPHDRGGGRGPAAQELEHGHSSQVVAGALYALRRAWAATAASRRTQVSPTRVAGSFFVLMAFRTPWRLTPSVVAASVTETSGGSSIASVMRS